MVKSIKVLAGVPEKLGEGVGGWGGGKSANYTERLQNFDNEHQASLLFHIKIYFESIQKVCYGLFRL